MTPFVPPAGGWQKWFFLYIFYRATPCTKYLNLRTQARRVKIAFLTPQFYNSWGGIGIYSVGLVKELSRLPDMDIHVFCPDVADHNAKERIDMVIGENVSVHTLCRAVDSPAFSLIFQLSAMREFPEFHRRYQFDMLHSADLVHMPELFLRFKDLGIPMVTTAHTTFRSHVKGLFASSMNPFNLTPNERLELFAYPALTLLEHYYLRKARHIISVSAAFKDHLREEYDFRGEIRVVHNGVDCGHFNMHSYDRSGCVKRFPALGKVKKPVLIYAGRISRQKGISLLLRSLRILQDQGIAFHLLVAGKGDEKALKGFIRSAGVRPEQVHFFGFVNNRDLAYLYKVSDIFIVPSYSEHFPISLLEAMSMGCCSIGTDVGSTDEIIDHEEDGLLIRPGDAIGMAGAIRRLIESPAFRAGMAEKGRQKVHTSFSADQMALKTRSYYLEILGRQ